jgi:hypothetical protein
VSRWIWGLFMLITGALLILLFREEQRKRMPLKPLNEFYKKGCHEKSFPSTGGREDFRLEIQPTSL